MDARSILLVPLLGATPALAQRTVEARRITMPTKDAGIYHVATGTWTRGTGAQASLGADVIYRADVPSGYFGVGWDGAEGVDEMVLPGPGNAKKAGPQEAYVIDGWRFEYCSLSAGPVTWTFRFYDSYVACDDPDLPANCLHQASDTLVLVGMPAAGFCWTVTVDLTGSGQEFCFEADGGPCAPGYQGGGLGLDHGGWGAILDVVDGAAGGPVLAGYNPSWAPEGEGTCYDPNLTCATGATGLGAQDLFAIGTPLNGCFWFGGWPQPCGQPTQFPSMQFSMVLYTDCSVEGSCADCPDGIDCATHPGNAADVAIDTCSCTAGSIVLSMAGAPPGVSTYPLVGDGSGAVVPPGANAELCLVGGSGIGRYAQDVAPTDAAGGASVDLLNAQSGGGGGGLPFFGGNLCAPAGQTWRFQWWHRDGMGPSRFSKAMTVTFK